MKHHFADWLNRSGGHWTVVPNDQRYADAFEKLDAENPSIRVVLIGKDTPDWQKCLTLPHLEEITLHQPSAEQFEAISHLTQIQRLRITHFRPKTLESLSRMVGLQELVLEYVSGFSDLSPLGRLSQLRSLHLENLRRVSDFSGLAQAAGLRYLSIFGTLDWKQPIADFEFLRGLTRLEYLGFAFVRSDCPYPAFLPATALKNLRKISLAPHYFAAQEYALLSVILAGVEGADWPAWRRFGLGTQPLPSDDPRQFLSNAQIRQQHPEVTIVYDGSRRIADPDRDWFEFTGLRAGRVKCSSPHGAAQCAQAEQRFEAMKIQARDFLAAHNVL